MKSSTVWIIAAIGLSGLVALVILMKEKSSSAQPQVLTIPTAAAPAQLQIPSYPPAPALPSLTVNATPTYQTINVVAPQIQNPGAAVIPDPQCQKPCNSCDSTGIVSYPRVVSERMVRSISNLSTVPNIRQQFPQNLYPWLYQNGGSA